MSAIKTIRPTLLPLILLCGIAVCAHAATETEILLGKGYAAYDAKNYEAAATALRAAAEKGHAGAMLSLAQMYRKGQGVPQDDAAAVQWYARAAGKNSEEAMYYLARSHELGTGTPANEMESVKWYLKSAEAGYADSMFMAGLIYEQGRPAAGVAANPAKAQAWYQEARDAGNEEALPRLLVVSLPSVPAAVGQQGLKGSMERAKETGFVLASRNDVGEAFRWWYYAAAQGEKAAMYNLGLLYFRGWGTKKNDVEALRWWSAAAASGHGAAQYDLGVMQENGFGLRRDDKAAGYWYRRAGENGFVQAKAAASALAIRVLLERAYAAEHSKSWGEARSSFEQAVKIGSVDAMTALGRLYESGSGVARNKGMAANWYQKAVAANHAEAMFRLGVMYQEDRPADIPATVVLYRQLLEQKTVPGDDTFWRESARRRLQEISMAKATPRFRSDYQAATTGDARAMQRLGEFYEQGQEGVVQNREEAFRWWQAAALRGNAAAMTLTGLRYLNAGGVQKNAPKGLEWLSHAALLGNVDAMAALVDVYRRGDEGIPAEQRKSSYWLDRYTAAQRASRQLREDDVPAYVAQPEKQSHAYLLLHDAGYAARFGAPVRPAGYSVVASLARLLPLMAWDSGNGRYVPVQDGLQEKVDADAAAEKKLAGKKALP